MQLAVLVKALPQDTVPEKLHRFVIVNRMFCGAFIQNEKTIKSWLRDLWLQLVYD